MDVMKRNVFILFVVMSFVNVVLGNLVLEVHHKFKGREKTMKDMIEHDNRRHGRSLSAVDVQFGGQFRPLDSGLYYAKIGLGTPQKDFYVQVDTGSNMLWVNCADCKNCPKKSDNGRIYQVYDPKLSKTGSKIHCGDQFCVWANHGHKPAGCNKETLCNYNVAYGNGSPGAAGYYVKDHVFLDQLTGNNQTIPVNGTVVFGCGTGQYGFLASSSNQLDGIIGFGRGNSSIIWQLASEKKMLKTFSHCLDSKQDGGIFAIGELVEPKVDFTPLIQFSENYDAMLKEVAVGGDYLEIPIDLFDSFHRRGVTIDSGTTLAYLPEILYKRIMKRILSYQPDLRLQNLDKGYSCFQFNGNVDDGFPTVMFRFLGSLNLTVYPHEYIFRMNDAFWCFGWQNSADHFKDGKNTTIFGDMVLRDKLVMYDIEKHAIGWTKYKCSSRIKVRDEMSRQVYTVGSHNIIPASSAVSLENGSILTLLLILTAVMRNFLS